MGQNLLFYTVAGTVVGGLLQWAGLGIGSVLMGSMVIPPVLLIGIRIGRYRGWF